MIEEAILNYLRENAFSCYMSMPEKPSGNFVSSKRPVTARTKAFTRPRWRCSPTAAAIFLPPG